MPLFQITGMTAVHTTFNVAFCLVSREDVATFKWVLMRLKSTAEAAAIALPKVLLIDFNKALKKAVRVVFNVVLQQICLWHILKNVVLNIK